MALSSMDLVTGQVEELLITPRLKRETLSSPGSQEIKRSAASC